MSCKQGFRLGTVVVIALVASGCADVLELVKNIVGTPQNVEGICLMEMPMTIYSDDPDLPEFSRRDLQRVTDELTSVVREELDATCNASSEECTYQQRLLLRNTGDVSRPESACGPESTNQSIPQGYNYNQCLFEWGALVLNKRKTFCSATTDKGTVPFEAFAAGIWIEAYRGEKILVSAVLVSLREKTIYEQAAIDKKITGSLSGRGYHSTLRDIAREAGFQMAELLKDLFRERGIE